MEWRCHRSMLVRFCQDVLGSLKLESLPIGPATVPLPKVHERDGETLAGPADTEKFNVTSSEWRLLLWALFVLHLAEPSR